MGCTMEGGDMPIHHVLREAAQPPAMSSDHTVMDAVRNMIDFDAGAIVVTDEDRRVVGIFTKKDLLGKVTALGRVPTRTRLGDVMSTEVITGAGRLSIAECLRLMSEFGIRHLPVVNEEDEFVGLISLCDLLRDRIIQMTQDIDSLEAYLNDAPGG